MSIDFDARNVPTGTAPASGGWLKALIFGRQAASASSIPVPLGLFKKAPLRAFDLREEDGQPLAVWTREQNDAVTAAALLQLAGAIAAASGSPMSKEVALDLSRMAGADGDALANAAWERFETPQPRDPDDSVRKLIRDSPAAWPLFNELREQFILIADLHEPWDCRRIVKLSYEESVRGDVGGGPLGWGAAKARTLLETLGWASFRFGFPTPALVDAASYHVEVTAPDDVMIAEASLKVFVADAEGNETAHVVATERGQDRAHLSINRKEAELRGWSLDAITRSLVDVRFSLKAQGLVMAAVGTSALTTALLWVGLHLHQHHIAPRPEAATAVLVVLPAIYAAYLAPGRDPLLRRMTVAMRALVFASSLVAFAAACALALKMSATDVVRLWHGLAVGSSAVTSVLSVSLLMAWIRQRPKG